MAEHIFTDDNFESDVLNAKGVVVVDFWASWCGPCKALGPVIEELCEDYTGKALIGKYSTEDNTKYASEFKVMSIPCVKFWKDGKYEGEIIGLRDKEEYEEMIEGLLK